MRKYEKKQIIRRRCISTGKISHTTGSTATAYYAYRMATETTIGFVVVQCADAFRHLVSSQVACESFFSILAYRTLFVVLSSINSIVWSSNSTGIYHVLVDVCAADYTHRRIAQEVVLMTYSSLSLHLCCVCHKHTARTTCSTCWITKECGKTKT